MGPGTCLRLAALATILMVPGAALAQVYKCTDKNGRVAYSQVKPRGSACEDSGVQPAPRIGSDVDNLMKYSGEIDKVREAEGQVRAEAQQQQAQRDLRCGYARRQLAGLQTANRVFFIDDKGQRQYQNDAQRDQMVAAAQAAVASECE
jgi:hypothetical protein